MVPADDKLSNYNEQEEKARARVAAQRQQAIHAQAEAIRSHAQGRAKAVEEKARAKANIILAKAEVRACRLEGLDAAPIPRRIRLDVHGRPKPMLRGWVHAIAAPLALAACIVLICLAKQPDMKIACAVFMVCSLILFGNSAAYHLGDWSYKTTDILRRIDHMNIFLLIAGTYTPTAFALEPFWRDIIITGIWSCTIIAVIMHVIWINTPRWLYVIVYIVFGVASVGFIGLFWVSPFAGPSVTILIASGGLCYILGAIVYTCRYPDPWPRVFGFHEIFHLGTVAGYTCQLIAIYMIVIRMWTM
ncbi:MAG: hemolysin III family protein [Bifidobacteriaceae bacterium]|nr:hemolysin III family protein [Bifidobacteriaceae bacterium]